jgi:hypothetical protein
MHERAGVGMFGGVVGRLLRETIAPGTALTGLLLGAAFLGIGFVFRLLQVEAIGQLLIQILMAWALARFALNGYAGEYRGSILSDAGGDWPQALAVAGRFLTLQLFWVVPAFLLVWNVVSAVLHDVKGVVTMPLAGATSPETPQALGALTVLHLLALLTMPRFYAAVGVLFCGMFLLPPLSLIASVRAAKYGEIFSAPLWREAFAGRRGDLFILYAVQAGGVLTGVVLVTPIVALAFTIDFAFGLLALAVAAGFLAGLTVTLVGRLCGFFAFGDESPAPAGVMPQAPPPEPSPSTEAPPEEEDSPLPPLADAADRVAAARRRFETDPRGAISELETLCAQHAPSPPVLHALALMLQASGRTEDAADVARAATVLCLKRGHTLLAAEVFNAFWKQSKALGLGADQLDLLAAALLKEGDLAMATNAFGLALSLDQGDRKAIKGLLQIADHRLHRESKPKDAARIYTFLLQYASASPFAEDMKRGLAEAEARLKRAV